VFRAGAGHSKTHGSNPSRVEGLDSRVKNLVAPLGAAAYISKRPERGSTESKNPFRDFQTGASGLPMAKIQLAGAPSHLYPSLGPLFFEPLGDRYLPENL
jgi:hypothetical protein